MRKDGRRIAYFLPVLAILILAGVDYLVYNFYGVSGVANWRRIFTVEGLLLDAIGAIIVLAGDLSVLRRCFIPTDQISRITEARFTLFDNEDLNHSERGFTEVRSIVNERTSIEGADVSDILQFEISVSSQDRVVATGQTESVYPCVESEDWSREEYLEFLSEGQEPQDHPYQRYDRLESVGTPSLVDGWLDQEVRDLEQSAEQVPLRIGVVFFLAGFSCQMIPQIASLLT